MTTLWKVLPRTAPSSSPWAPTSPQAARASAVDEPPPRQPIVIQEPERTTGPPGASTPAATPASTPSAPPPSHEVEVVTPSTTTPSATTSATTTAGTTAGPRGTREPRQRARWRRRVAADQRPVRTRITATVALLVPAGLVVAGVVAATIESTRARPAAAAATGQEFAQFRKLQAGWGRPLRRASRSRTSGRWCGSHLPAHRPRRGRAARRLVDGAVQVQSPAWGRGERQHDARRHRSAAAAHQRGAKGSPRRTASWR